MSSVTIEMMGRSFEIAPYKIGDLRRAAPFIDRMNALMKHVQDLKEAGEEPGVVDMADLTRALIDVLAIGIAKIDPAMTADVIEDAMDISFVNSLREAIFAILAASGFAPKGEAPALSSAEPATEGAEA